MKQSSAMSDERVERVAKKLAAAHDRTLPRMERGAWVAYNAGVGMTVEYWNGLAKVALEAFQPPEPQTQETFEVRPCVNHLGNQTGWDICRPTEPGATGCAVVATVYESKGMAEVMAFAGGRVAEALAYALLPQAPEVSHD